MIFLCSPQTYFQLYLKLRKIIKTLCIFIHASSITDYYLNLLFYLIKDLNINNDICFEVWRVAHVSICNRPAL